MPDPMPQPLDSWQLLSVRTPETPEQLVAPGGCSASVLTHEAQWLAGETPRDPLTNKRLDGSDDGPECICAYKTDSTPHPNPRCPAAEETP